VEKKRLATQTNRPKSRKERSQRMYWRIDEMKEKRRRRNTLHANVQTDKRNDFSPVAI